MQLEAEEEPDTDKLGERDNVPVLQPEVDVDCDGEEESVEVTQPDALTDAEEDPDTLGVNAPVLEPVTDAEEEGESTGEDDIEVVREAVTHAVAEGLCDTLEEALVVVHKLGVREPEAEPELVKEEESEGERVPDTLYELLMDTLAVVDWEGVKVVEIVKLFVAEGVEDPDTLGLGEPEIVMHVVEV